MATQNAQTTDTASREIVLSRRYDAPRELVWTAFTDPKHVAQWWGPDGFTITVHEMDVRPGGVWRFIMHGPNGVDYPNKIVYREVVKPERLAYTHSGDGDDVGGFAASVTLAERNGGTEVTLRALFATAEEREKQIIEHGAIEGGKQTLERLAAYLPTIA